MRPFIDLNNLSYSKETLIYKTRANILIGILIVIVLFVWSISALKQNEFAIASIIFFISVFPIHYLIKSIKTIDEIQFRINSKGIQYKEQALVSWSNIENERVDIKPGNQRSSYYFVYHIIEPNQIMRFDISSLSTNFLELQHTLTIHRNRFKRENNIQ
ncbi:hypothetical protein SAMN05444671_3310 [Flavobacterium sp. CF108]|nr:hypothetical protein SAMN04487978_2745 [Flavobacterium sp. fv08]SHH65648.1 hypothetical protein SAMN05444671_3310 [Flavobacterium sp. CF108]